MPDVTISKYNETYMHIESTEESILSDICEYFSFEIENRQFNPSVRYGKWDGIIRLFNRRTNLMYIGLHDKLIEVLKQHGHSFRSTVSIGGGDLTNNDLLSVIRENIPVSTEGVTIEPYPYQLDAIRHMVNSDRSVVLAATSAGKSLILYLTIRMYQLMPAFEDVRMMVVVPSSGLVEQMYNDFDDYSQLDDNWDVSDQCQRVSGKYSKSLSKNIIITTWQSATKLDAQELNETVGAVFVDECHTCKGTVLKDMLERLDTVGIRHGLTGTLDNVESNELMIQGLLGPSKRIVSAIDLMNNGAATVVDIHQITINYPDSAKKYLETLKSECKEGTEKYRVEMEFIESYEPRHEMIKTICDSYAGNTLLLYSHLAHGEALTEVLDNTLSINGDVKVLEREEIRQQMEREYGVNLVASYGTCSAGISIKNLHNMVLTAPSKSVIRVLQSVGRMMRKHKSKERAFIIDIVDNLGDDCYSVSHACERLKYYRNEQFNIRYLDISI